jgi:hypothetical protein
MATSEKIKDIDSRIQKLASRKKKLEDKRKTQISTIITRCGANTLPDDILAGAILDAVRAYAVNDSRINSWKNEGIKITKPGRGRKKFA